MQLSAGVNSTDGNNICGGSILDNRFARPKPDQWAFCLTSPGGGRQGGKTPRFEITLKITP